MMAGPDRASRQPSGQGKAVAIATAGGYMLVPLLFPFGLKVVHSVPALVSA